jgi:hypothetical protein
VGYGVKHFRLRSRSSAPYPPYYSPMILMEFTF